MLPASKPHWLNYDDDKFDRVFHTIQAARRGSELHAFAAEAIRLKQPLRNSGTTIDLYVNHSIGFNMDSEVMLMHSPNAFGTVDAIGFRKKILRIHDLKTGQQLASMAQLKCYGALFCLEYMEKPFEIKTVMRIYQSDSYKEEIADPDEIVHIMERYKERDRRIYDLRREMEL